MYKNVLSSIPGIEYYPIIALVFFFGFFVALIVWYLRVDVEKLNLAAHNALLESLPKREHKVIEVGSAHRGSND
jgi:hypothetical protein